MKYCLTYGSSLNIREDKITLPAFTPSLGDQKYPGVSFEHWFHYHEVYTMGLLTKKQLLHYWNRFKHQASRYLMNRSNWEFIGEKKEQLIDFFNTLDCPLWTSVVSVYGYNNARDLKEQDMFDIAMDISVNMRRYIECVLEEKESYFIPSVSRVKFRDSFIGIEGFSKALSALLILDTSFDDYSLSEKELVNRLYTYYRLHFDRQFNKMISSKRIVVRSIFSLNIPLSVDTWKHLILRYCRVGSTISLFINNCLYNQYPFEYIRVIWKYTPDIDIHHHVEKKTMIVSVGKYIPKNTTNYTLIKAYGLCYLSMINHLPPNTN